MAHIIHAYTDQTKPLAKLTTLNEPGATGITVRYTELGSAVMIAAFLMNGRCRNGIRIMTEAERQDYLLDRAVDAIGQYI